MPLPDTPTRCPQHPTLVRCAHFGERFIYEAAGDDEHPVTSIVGVEDDLATGLISIPQEFCDYDLALADAWQYAHGWLRYVSSWPSVIGWLRGRAIREGPEFG